MAQRSFWKGYLKLSLVTCPVAMMPATSDAEKIKFHTLNRATGNRIEARYVDAETGKTVKDEDEVKGYEQAADQYVMLEDDELQAVALESTRTINIDMFVPANSIETIWYDKPHYLVPDDPVGEEAFSVIREAMAATNTVGLSRVVLYRRERAVLLQPRDNGIVLWTLRYGDEVRDADPYFADTKSDKVEPKLLSLVTALIDQRTRDWETSMVHDPVQENLQAIIAAKKKGKPAQKKKSKETTPAPASNVINIMDALKKSMAAEKAKRT
jgi:DNA end-binding protein Ku